MIFNTSLSYFHENSFHYFIDYLMMKLTLGKVVRYDNPPISRFLFFHLCLGPIRYHSTLADLAQIKLFLILFEILKNQLIMLNNLKFMVALSIIVQVHEDNPTEKTIENFW